MNTVQFGAVYSFPVKSELPNHSFAASTMLQERTRKGIPATFVAHSTLNTGPALHYLLTGEDAMKAEPTVKKVNALVETISRFRQSPGEIRINGFYDTEAMNLLSNVQREKVLQVITDCLKIELKNARQTLQKLVDFTKAVKVEETA